MKRRIPIDETFAQILADAARYREELAAENLRRIMKRPQTRPIILAGNIF